MLPTKLEIKNFKSITDSVLHFDFSSALIVGERNGDSRKSNGCGKTAVLQSICFALFGETEDENADDVVKRGQVACEVVLYFTHDNESYRIRRTRTARYSKMTTEFDQLLPDGSWKSRSGDTNKITDSVIESTIKSNHQVFINSSYFRQNSFFDFGEGTFSTRQSLMSSLLSIDKWNKYQKSAKTKFDDYIDEIQNIKDKLILTENSAVELQATNQRLIDIIQELRNIADSEVQINSEVTDLDKRIGNSSSTAENAKQLSLIKKMITDQESKLSEKRSELSSAEEGRNRAKETLSKNSKALGELNTEENSFTKRIAELNPDKIKDTISKMEQAILDGKSKNRSLSAQIDNLKNNDSCSLCGHSWEDPEAKHGECLSKIKELEIIDGKLERAQAKLISTKQELDQYRDLELQLAKLSAKKTGISSSSEHTAFKIQTYDKDISSLNSVVLQLEKSILENKNKLHQI